MGNEKRGILRLIERELVDAIRTSNNYKKDNTKYCRSTGRVFLFNNRIAKVVHGLNHSVRVMEINLCGFPTSTTLSRLRALGLNIYKSKGQVWIEPSEIDAPFLVPSEGICKLQGRYLN